MRYPGEEPSEDEIELALENLEKYNYTVNYILTHKYEETPGRGTVCADLQRLTEFINANVHYDKWFAGHWHTEGKIDEKHILVYDRCQSINED